MSGDCGCEVVVAEGSVTNIGILPVHRDAFITAARRPPPSAGGSHRLPLEWKRSPLLSDHALLVKVPDHLGDHPDKLARNIRDILLG